MKRIFLLSAAVLTSLAFTSCDGGKDQDQVPGHAGPNEQPVPKTPGEELLAVMLAIKDQSSADANAVKVRELGSKLPKDVAHGESVDIMNEMLRFASQECYGSVALEDALKVIRFDAGEYTGSVPLEVDGFEPTPEDQEK